MKIGDRVFVRGYVDEIRKDTVIVRNDGGYFGTIPSEVITGELPSAQLDVPDMNVGDMISRQAAIEALHMHLMYRMGTDSNKKRLDDWINGVPPAQPEQLEQCPIYGGMCAYPSDQCYDCPRHAGAKMGVTT